MLRVQYAQLMFYASEGYWHHAEEYCSAVIHSTDDWLFRVWRGVCLDQQGLANEALKEYKAAESHRGTTLPATAGMHLIYTRNRDTQAAQATEAVLHDDRYKDDVDGWLQVAAMYWLTGDVNRARDVLLNFPVDKAAYAEHGNEYTHLATLRGWVDLSTGRAALLEKCGAWFQAVLEREKSYGQGEGATSSASAAHALVSDAANATSNSNNTAGQRESISTAQMIAMNSHAGGGLDIHSALGRVAYLERKYQFAAAQELLNKLIVAYPQLPFILVVKARLLMRAEDWEQAMEVVRRVLDRDASHCDALALSALHSLVKDVHPTRAAGFLERLLAAVQQREPRNARLFFTLAQVFSRLAGSQLRLLNLTGKFAEAARALDTGNGDYLCEVAAQQFYKGDYKTALTTFNSATTLTDSLTPLLGVSECEIQLGKLAEAAKHVAFCNELQPSTQRNAELSLLNSMIAWRHEKDQTRALLCLDQAAETVRQALQQASTAQGSGLELYVLLNLPLTLRIAQEYMQHVRNEPPDPSFRHPDAIGERCRRVLEQLLLRHVPGCVEAQLLLARIHFISGDVARAEGMIRHVLQQEQPLAEAYLLSAQICQYVGNPRLAAAALEQALTIDFEIREQPYYNLLLGIVRGLLHDTNGALEALQQAMKLVKNTDRVTSQGRPIQPLSLPDHVTLYVQLAQVYLRLRDVEEARRLLAEATQLFAQTTQIGRVWIAQAMLAARTDLDRSIELLKKLEPSDEFFIPARTQLARLYLVQLQKPLQYIQCFEEVADVLPTAQSFVSLGEAYSTVQEPEKAVMAYEKARALDPGNSELAVRVGRAFVATHDYEKAVHYYEDALAADETLFNVRADLAMLYWHLGHAGKAVQTLQEAPVWANKAPAADEGIATAVERVNCALLIYKIYTQTASGEQGQRGSRSASEQLAGAAAAARGKAIEVLRKARVWQQHVLETQLRHETRETALQQKTVMATIDTELAKCFVALALAIPDALSSASASASATPLTSAAPAMTSAPSAGLAAAALLSPEQEERRRWLQQAQERLQEALKYDETNEPAMLELARVYLHRGELESCEQQCNSLRRMQPDHEAAALLLAQVQLRRHLFDDAVHLYEQLLQRHPSHYEVLVSYVTMCCRSGHMESAAAALEKAAEGSSNSSGGGSNSSSNGGGNASGQRAAPGLSYARGIYLRCTNANAEALRAFSLARSPAGNPWRARALVQMIQIYLVPSTVEMWEDNWAQDEKTDNVRCAELLLLQLPLGPTRDVLQAYALLALKRKPEREQAMQVFLNIIGTGHGQLSTPKTSQKPQPAAEGDNNKNDNGTAAADEGAAADNLDEDDVLLQDVQAGQSNNNNTNNNKATAATPTTLADVLQRESGEAWRSSVRQAPAAYLGLAIGLFLENQDTAASKVLDKLLPASMLASSATSNASPLLRQNTTSSSASASLVKNNNNNNAGSSNAGALMWWAGHEAQDEVEGLMADQVLERAMLFRAYMDVKAGRLETAQAMLRQLLERNTSYGAAWHALGALQERQQHHAEASACYAKAWKLVQESDPTVGYRLAFNYLKGNDPVKAIDVCRTVLTAHPDYPRLEEDVIQVAYGMLRP